MTREPFRLGAWRVDPGLCEIANDEQTLHIEPRSDARFAELAARMNLLRYWEAYGWPDACSDSQTKLPCTSGKTP
jgi:hypothetical protein